MTEDTTIFQAVTGSGPNRISIVAMISGDDKLHLLREGKWVDGRFDKNIRIDRDSHFASVGSNDIHAHVYGRRDRDNALVAVRLDGSKSHDLGGHLHRDDADALRALGLRSRATT